jgi:hypothetical protein
MKTKMNIKSRRCCCPPNCSKSLRLVEIMRKKAWFKKGSGTVVRSTLRAVPATVPDPFLNHARKNLIRSC